MERHEFLRAGLSNVDSDCSAQFKVLLDFAVSFKDEYGWSLLHYAARYNLIHIVKPLLEAGADVTATDRWERTPLHYAAANGHIEVVSMLLDGGAVLAAVDNNNETPLHWATRRGQKQVIELLIHRGADPNDVCLRNTDMVLVGENNLTIALSCQYVHDSFWTVAKGDGWLGQWIQDIARKRNIPIVQSDPCFVQDIFTHNEVMEPLDFESEGKIAEIYRSVTNPDVPF